MVYSSPAVVNGKVYVGSQDGNLYCLDADDGRKVWSYQTGDVVYSSPAVADGKVYVGSCNKNVYCLNADNGSKIWVYRTGGKVLSSPAIANGKVYIGSDDGKVYCFEDEFVNRRPDAPSIDGQTNGSVGSEYTYSLQSIDPDGDDVKYFIDWGDKNSEWTDYYVSGMDVKVNHTWKIEGTYIIKAKAKDTNGAESEWAYLEVTMPKNKPFKFNFPLLNWLFERFPKAFPVLRQLLSL